MEPLRVIVRLAFMALVCMMAQQVADGAVAPSTEAVHAAVPYPQRIVAQKHHSQKLLTESQLRKSAGKLKQAAKKLMSTKPEELMPTWSTTTPLPQKKVTILEEGKKNLKLQEKIASVEKHDDHYFQADDASTSGN